MYGISITASQEESLRGMRYSTKVCEPDILRKSNHHLRTLYGIIAFKRRKTPLEYYCHYGYYIPRENMDSVTNSLTTHWFSKTMLEDDLPILEYIYRKTIDLNARYCSNWPVYFSLGELSGRILLSKQQARRRLSRLTGLLTKCVELYDHQDTERPLLKRTAYRPFWFLATNRRAFVKCILEHRPSPKDCFFTAN